MHVGNIPLLVVLASLMLRRRTPRLLAAHVTDTHLLAKTTPIPVPIHAQPYETNHH